MSRERLGPWVLATPTVLTVLVFAVYPLAFIVAIALSQSTLGRPFTDWVGLTNFRDAVADPVVVGSLGRSVVFALVSAAICVTVGSAVAVLLDMATRGGRVLRTLILLPLLTPPAAVGIAWRLLLDASGLVNDALRGVGLLTAPIAFLGSSPWAFIAVVVADVWQWTPLVTLLVFAALRGVPHDVREAAQVDGATAWDEFRHVTLPTVLPAVAAVALLKVILAFKLFDLVYIVTGGGPGFDTTTSTFHIYRTALEAFNIGRAGAETLLYVVFVTVFTLPFVALRARAERRLS